MLQNPAGDARPLRPLQRKDAENAEKRRGSFHVCLFSGALAAKAYLITETGERVRRNLYQLFVSLNVRRADLGLPQFFDPPVQAVFDSSFALDLVVTNLGDRVTIKLLIQGATGQFVVVQAAKLKRSGVRLVQHFPSLALLAAPADGIYDLTEPFVARYGKPTVHQAVWMRVFQHTDGWIDVPKVLRARVLPPTA